MAQAVYTKDTIDGATGEVITKEIFRKQIAAQDQFIRTFVSDIADLAKCSGAEKGVVLCSLQYLDYNTNEFILTPERRADMCGCAGIKPDTVNSSISRLIKKKVIIKKSGSTYILNPKMFFYGKELERANVIKVVMTYENTGKSSGSKKKGFTFTKEQEEFERDQK